MAHESFRTPLIIHFLFSASEENSPEWKEIDEKLKKDCIFISSTFFMVVQVTFFNYVMMGVFFDFLSYIIDESPTKLFNLHTTQNLE